MNWLRQLLFDGPPSATPSPGWYATYLADKTHGDMWPVWVETALKLVFVLIVVFSFSLVLVWAERRQSAMIQDRVGPTRAGFQLSPRLTKYFGNYRVAAGLVGLAVLLLLAVLMTPVDSLGWLTGRELAVLAQTGEVPWHFTAFVTAGPFIGLVLALLALGTSYTIHRNDGHIALLGLLHSVADAIKSLTKEDFVPPQADKVLHALAPILTVSTAILAFAVIPFADTLYVEYIGAVLPTDGQVGGGTVPMQVASLNVGILFIFAVAGTGVVGAAIAGYSSDNKYALLGGLRAASQMVSYEVTLGLTIVPAFMVYGTLLLEDMVVDQELYNWGILGGPSLVLLPCMLLAAVTFLVTSIAETKRIPFDLPEGESELAAGYFTEYSGLKFGMFFMGEFIEVVVLSAIFVTMFFGGYELPFLDRGGFDLPLAGVVPIAHWGVAAIQMVTFVAKVTLVVWFQLMIRWTLPRLRYDQLMNMCWKLILPISLVNILLTGILILLVL